MDACWGKVTVVIVSYNSAKVLERCIAGLGKASRVVVVDNASADGSAPLARRMGVQVIANPANYGFGYACNQGAHLAETEFVLFINPDAVLDDGALERLMAESDAHHAAVAAPVLLDREGRPELRTGSFQEIRNDFSDDPADIPDGPCCSAFLTGAVLLWRMADWRAIGGFDERIFLFWEDVDLCVRAVKARKPMLLVPDARALHLAGGSTPPSKRVRWVKDWHITWGDLYCQAKHYSAEAARARAWAYIRRRGLRLLWALLTLRSRRVYRNAAVIAAAWTFLRRYSGDASRLAAWTSPGPAAEHVRPQPDRESASG